VIGSRLRPKAYARAERVWNGFGPEGTFIPSVSRSCTFLLKLLAGDDLPPQMASQKTREALGELSRGEVSGSDLGDTRREGRLMAVVDKLGRDPARGFPKVFRSDKELEGFYRLVENHQISWEDIGKPHQDATVERCRQAGLVLAISDTTEVGFGGATKRAGLGVLTQGNQGFFLHTTLAVSADGTRNPLGVLGLKPYIRTGQAANRTESERVVASRKKPQADKESHRWLSEAANAERAVGPDVEVIHVHDREADSFVLLAYYAENEMRFVIRVNHDRLLTSHDGVKLSQALETLPSRIQREVPLTRRRKINRAHAHPARAERLATLEIRAGVVELPRPESAQTRTKKLTVNVVHVYEPNPPPGEEPVDWKLYTSEPIDTVEQIEQVVDYYRARWTIEEYFKALKTGCSYESRQLEDYDSLLRLLAIFAPIAWGLLLLRSISRQDPQLPASVFFFPLELKLLRHLSKRVKLSDDPTISEAMRALAAVGGHLKRNGEPGWQTLADGLRDLRMAAEACEIFQQNSDR
jgi:hypothetical protein